MRDIFFKEKPRVTLNAVLITLSGKGYSEVLKKIIFLKQG